MASKPYSKAAHRRANARYYERNRETLCEKERARYWADREAHLERMKLYRCLKASA